MLKSKCIKRIVLGGLLSLFVFAMPVFAAGNLPVKQETKQEQLNRKLVELRQIEDNIALADAEGQKLSSQQVYELAQRDVQQKKDNYQKAKDVYDRASKNADMFTQEQLVQFLGDYKNAEKRLKAAEAKLQEIKSEKERIEGSFNALKKEKKEKEIEILGIKAELYEDELSKAVWVEGVGECIMDESKSMKDCEKLALEYARRDAVEKGGKSLIEAVTQVKMFELTRDDIKKTAKVNIIDQDNSGEFGKVKKIPFGDMFKFTVTVRLKIQSITTYNPYREKMKELQGEEKPVSSSSEPIQKPEEKDKKPAQLQVHSIGESYGGGIVFYVSDNGQHGLIAATADQSTGMRWYAGRYIKTGATADGVGTGKENTARIIAKQGDGDGGNYAAKLCDEYSIIVEGVIYDDWYLPSKHELTLLYQQRNVVGNFSIHGYWSSTEYNASDAWGFNFGDSNSDGDKEYFTNRVRAVRAF
ncbi:MAG: DUF1566 domain-containing protein [Candidatus Desantisbacteria bacterium]